MNINLMHGDCLELMKNIPDGSVDMILCDLPYGTTNNSWDKVIPFAPLWEQYHRVCKKNAAIVLFSQLPFLVDMINSNRKEFRYEWVWEKTMKQGFPNANKMPLRAHENIAVFYRHLPTYNPQKFHIITESYGRNRKQSPDRCKNYKGLKTKGGYIDTGERFPFDVIKFSNWNGALFGNLTKVTKHPTQKPVPLLEYLIKTYTNEGETVLDNTMGSGSTGVACVNTNRHFIGIELDDNYFEIAQDRIDKAIKDKQSFLFPENIW